MEIAVAEKTSNRRNSRRCRARSTIRLECRKGTVGLGVNLATTLMDVSETGARLVVSQEMVLMQEVEIAFTGYGMKQQIKRLATVRWQLKLDDGKYCIGVEFQKRLPYADLQNIASPS